MGGGSGFCGCCGGLFTGESKTQKTVAAKEVEEIWEIVEIMKIVCTGYFAG